MTLLGKIFIGLVFVLSLSFFTASALITGSHIDHASAATESETEARAAESRNLQLEQLLSNYKEELDSELASRREALAALQVQYEAANASFLEKEQEAAQLREDLTRAAQQNEASHAEMNRAAEANRNLRDQIVAAKQARDDLFKKLLASKAAFNSFQGTLQSLQDRAEDLTN